ncbi:unnamed protein product [Cunninghamella echinulata]
MSKPINIAKTLEEEENSLTSQWKEVYKKDIQEQQQQQQRKYSQLAASDSAGLFHKASEVREEAKRIGKARIKWSKPKVAMIITKPGDYTLIGMTRELALWLIETPRYGESTGITVYVDEKIKNSTKFKYSKIINRYPNTVNKLKFWNPELCSSQPSLFDFIITLGGDGTVLFSSWLFQNYIPPVIPFHLGSLGFLTPFDFNHYDKYLTKALDNGVRINLRGRLTCTVYRRVPDYNQSKEKKAEAIKLRNIKRNLITGKITMGNWCKMHEHGKKKKKLNKFGEIDGIPYDSDENEEEEDDYNHLYDNKNKNKNSNNKNYYNNEDDDQNGYEEHRQVPCFTTIPVEEYHVINELVVDRGPSPYVSQLELFGDNRHLTTVQADGLAISTPTGSTAYSLSAGGSLTDPGIHATLITPICPHTLSFRPTLVPDSMELRICVPYNSRNTAWASFDGRGRVEIKQGDHVKVTASKYPFPTVCKEDQASDWFNSLQKCLHWNKRERQKSFAVVESNSRRRPSSQSRGSTTPTSRSSSNSLKNLPNFSMTPMTPHSTTPSNATTNTNNNNNNNNNTDGKQQHSPPNTATSSSSSEFGYDEIFGLFSDDDKRKRRHSIKSETDASSISHSDENSDSSSSIYLESDSEEDEFSDDDDDDNGDEEKPVITFQGWTDTEIEDARRRTRLAKLQLS